MNRIDENFLAHYLSGQLSARERSRVEHWYKASEENAALLDNLYQAHILKRSMTAMYQANPARGYAEFKMRIDEKQKRDTPLRRLYTRKSVKWASAVAVFAMAVVLSGFIGVRIAGHTEYPITVRTNIGERTQVDLPDGSKVWLNSCSEIKYGFAIFSKERKVSLSGEAYFEVEKNEGKPFVVNCDGMDVRVLGTRFNVMSNPDNETLYATLLEGSLLVKSPFIKNRRGIVLQPQDELVIDKLSGGTRLSNNPHADLSISWIDGKLHFDGDTFEQIARTLERNYNIEIVFKDDRIRQRKFACDFSTYDNIYRIMSILRLTEKFDYRIEGRNIYIESR